MKFRTIAAAALVSVSLGFPMAAYAQTNPEVTAQIQAASGDLDAMIELALGLAQENPALLEQIVGDAVGAAPGDEAEVAAAFAESFPDSVIRITTAASSNASPDAVPGIAGAVAAVAPDQAPEIATAAAEVAPGQAGSIVAQVSEASGVSVQAVAAAVSAVVPQSEDELVAEAEEEQATEEENNAVEEEQNSSDG